MKNGIVMIDYAHHLHEGGLPFQEAVERAARIRLRPILMTTLCTLFGLLPLALGLGAGAELQKPLALVVIGGLSLSTLVTLFAVPTFYVGLRRRSEDKKPPVTPAPAPAVCGGRSAAHNVRMTEQRWDPRTYAQHARFVSDSGRGSSTCWPPSGRAHPRPRMR